MFDGTSDTNIPDKAKRYNTSTNKFEVYSSSGGTWSVLPFHTPIDNHIADVTLHTGVPVGGIIEFGGSVAPTNFLFCNGAAVSRTTYAALFTAIGTTYGSGDGSTTFNLPDTRGRFLLSKAASGTGSTLGGTGGSLDHAHAVSNHSHAIAGHTHTLSAHTHSIPAHTHTVADHTHSVSGHYHGVSGNGATINISSSGGHTHTVRVTGSTVSGSGSVSSRLDNNGTGSGTSLVGDPPIGATGSEHTHDASTFSGNIGNVNSGVNGDSGFTSGAGGAGTTGSGGSGTSGTPSSDVTSSTSLTTNTDGGSTTSSNNPAYLVINHIIRY